MILKPGLLLSIGLLFSSLVMSQDLYMPRDVKEVYRNKTRTLKGTPGENYWQNTIQLKDIKDVFKLNLDGGIFMDADPSNNIWNSKK